MATARSHGTSSARRGNRSGARRGARTAGTLTLVAMSLGFGVVQLDVTIVNTALDAIGRGLGGGVATLQWVVNTYTIAFAALILTAGALGDRLGAKRTFQAGFAIFTLASLGCALAPNAAALIVARAIQGFGAAILVPNSLALLNHAFRDVAERGRAVGFWAAGASVALTAGPLFGGMLIALANWRAIFFVNVPIGAFAMWLTARYVTETPSTPGRKLDLPGQVLAIATLSVLAAALIGTGTFGWTVFPLAGLFASLALGVAFVLRETRTQQPMLPPALFAKPAFSLATATGFLVNVVFYGLIFVLSLYFQRVDGWTPLQTGLAFLPMLGLVLPANILAPRVAERIGAPATIAIGCVVAAAGAAGLAIAARGTPYVALCAQLLALGGGLGLLVPPMTAMLLGSVDKAASGIASGVLNSSRQTGSVVGVALFGSLIASRAVLVAGLHAALAISTVVLVATAALAFARRRAANAA